MKSEIYLHLLEARSFSMQDFKILNSDVEFLGRQFSSIEGLRKIHLKDDSSSIEYLIEDIFKNSFIPIHSKYTQEELRELKAI